MNWQLRVSDAGRLGFKVWARQNWRQLLGWGLALLVVLVVFKRACTPEPPTYHTEVTGYDYRTGQQITRQVLDTPEWKRQHEFQNGGGSSERWGRTGNPQTDEILNHFQENFGADLVALLFGIALGWFLLRWIILLVVAFVCLGLLIFGAISGLWEVYLVAGFIIGTQIALYLRRLARRRRAVTAAQEGENTTFGSAKWATAEHLLKNGLILSGKPGYLLGYFQVNGERYPVTYSGDRHLLTVAPTRAGKGVSSIIPNLLTHRGSCLVIDPKGENARVTAGQRAALGQEVHVIDPWGITGMEASRFNPLAWLDPADPDVAENAFMLADAMVMRSPNSNPFFEEEALSLLWGFILYVAIDPRFAAARHLGTVRDMLSLGNTRLFGMLNEMYQHPNRIVSFVAERALAKEEETRANVFASVQAQTVFLDSDKMRDTLSGSGKTFRFEDLKGKAMSVYLVLPADRLGTYGRWLRLLIQQAITCNARNLGVKPAGGRPILFMLDEMAALGKLTKVEEAYGLMAGFGMQLWGIVQDLGQLDRIYDKGWETFIGNSGVLQYYGSRDEKTAAYFSKLCGVATVEKRSLTRSISRSLGISTSRSSSHSSAPGGGSSSYGTSHSTSDSTTHGYSETADVVQRHLAFPDELMVMRKDQALLLVETFNPIDGRKVVWYDEPSLARLGVNIQGQEVTPLLPGPAVEAAPFVIPGTEGMSATVDVNTGKPAVAPAPAAAATADDDDAPAEPAG